jgi:hypothetical protein
MRRRKKRIGEKKETKRGFGFRFAAREDGSGENGEKAASRAVRGRGDRPTHE